MLSFPDLTTIRRLYDIGPPNFELIMAGEDTPFIAMDSGYTPFGELLRNLEIDLKLAGDHEARLVILASTAHQREVVGI